MSRRLVAIVVLVYLATGCSGAPTKPVVSTQLADESRTAAALFRQGIESAKREDFSRAEQYLSAAVARGYSESRAVPWLVRVCLASERLRTALHYAEPYLARHPDDPALLQLVAAIHLSLGDAPRARIELEHALELEPNYAPARYLLAVTLRDSFDEKGGAARELAAYLLASPRGGHVAEARTFLREYARRAATRPSQDPIRPYRGGIGSRSSSQAFSPGASRASGPVAR